MAKKILMLAYTGYLTDARPRREAETLVARGDQVEFLCLNEAGRPRQETVRGVHVLRSRMGRYRGSSSVRYLLSYFQFWTVSFLRVAGRAVRTRYDVVVVHTMPDFLVFAALGARLRGARVILNMHDMMPELYMSKFGLRDDHWLIRLIRLEEKLSFSFAHHIICVHEPHRDLLIARGARAEKISLVMNVPDPSVFGECTAQPVKERRSHTVVYHGSIAARLGVDLAVQAFPRVLQRVPDARLRIIGDGDLGESVERLIGELGLGDSVEFARRFFRVEEIPGLLADVGMGIIPNRRDDATELMLPVKLLEYVHLGIPVVAPRLRVIEYYFGDDALAYYEPGDASGMAETLSALLLDAGRQEALAANASKAISRISWVTMKQNLFFAIDHN